VAAPAAGTVTRQAQPVSPVVATLRALFDAAVASAQAQACIPPHVPHPRAVPGRLVVLGAGKAAAAMAQVVEQLWAGALSGLVVTRYGHALPCRRIEVVEAAHPVPDAAGMQAARRMLDLAARLDASDTVLCLLSGGGSALLTLPLPGLMLADLQGLQQALLASGAGIGEINTLRRHLSLTQGGRLGAACHPARVITLAISDVPGDRPADIASGPTVADETRCADALAIARRWRIELPPAARQALQSGAAETVKPGDARLARAEFRLVATPQQALEAAARVARRHGYAPHILGDALQGQARDVGQVLAGIALQTANRSQPFAPPCALISGGETTVTVRGHGRGGRNVECLLSFALACDGHRRIHALMADTDGVDGAVANAGAWAGPQTLQQALGRGLDPRRFLDDNDAHSFFEAVGTAIVTGPTQTNVNDLRVVLIER